jgi:hypothetical protein
MKYQPDYFHGADEFPVWGLHANAVIPKENVSAEIVERYKRDCVQKAGQLLADFLQDGMKSLYLFEVEMFEHMDVNLDEWFDVYRVDISVRGRPRYKTPTEHTVEMAQWEIHRLESENKRLAEIVRLTEVEDMASLGKDGDELQ